MSIIDKSIQKLEQAQKNKADKEQANVEVEKTEAPKPQQNTITQAMEQSVQTSTESVQEKQAESEQVTPQENGPIEAVEPTVAAEPEQPAQSPEPQQSAPQPHVVFDEKLLAERGYLVDSSVKSAHTEEFRSLKRKVINTAFGGLSHTLKANNLIMVTSCSPGEGKTFNAINLALSIAQERDKTVLLVDSDVLRPSIDKQLNINTELGLTDYLHGKVENLADVMLTTSIEKLRILPAGNFYTLSSELLASNKMIDLVYEFATRYKDRIVIFDAPPMLGINETAVLAELVGQILVVVEEDKTNMGDVQTLVSLLPETVAKGFIINKSVTNKSIGYADYGY